MRVLMPATDMLEAGRAALKVAEQFIALTKPTLVNGRWRKPAINARAVNRLRKEATVEGLSRLSASWMHGVRHMSEIRQHMLQRARCALLRVVPHDDWQQCHIHICLAGSLPFIGMAGGAFPIPLKPLWNGTVKLKGHKFEREAAARCADGRFTITNHAAAVPCIDVAALLMCAAGRSWLRQT